MAAKLTRLTHKIATQLHLVAERCTIYSSRSRRPFRKLLDTPSCVREVTRCTVQSLLAPVSIAEYKGGSEQNLAPSTDPRFMSQ